MDSVKVIVGTDGAQKTAKKREGVGVFSMFFFYQGHGDGNGTSGTGGIGSPSTPMLSHITPGRPVGRLYYSHVGRHVKIKYYRPCSVFNTKDPLSIAKQLIRMGS